MKNRKNNFRNFLTKHWIGCWIVLSLLFALIIQILFSIKAPNKFLVAHWGAGDILAYASTVALGLLSLWQNKCQKEENDKAQERLKNISNRANELNIINKIIEHETNRLTSLQKALDDFTNACDPQTIALESEKEGIENIPSLIGLTELEKRIDNAFINIARLLREDKELCSNDKHPFKQAYACLYQCAKDTITDLREDKINLNDQNAIQNIGDTLSKFRDTFFTEREKYLTLLENKLNRVLFENLSLEEIRNIYNVKSL